MAVPPSDDLNRARRDAALVGGGARFRRQASAVLQINELLARTWRRKPGSFLAYREPSLEPPEVGNLLACCSRPRGDLAVDP